MIAWLTRIGLTRDSALWIWLKLSSLATLITSGVINLPYWAGYLGIPLSPTGEHWIQVIAIILLWIGAQLSTSALPGKNAAHTVNASSWTNPAAAILLALGLSAMLLPLSGCAKKPPTLSPAGQIAVVDLQVIKAIDVLRDTAIGLNAQTPPMMPTATVRLVVTFHESTVKVIAASPNGWKPTVLAALSQLQLDLPPADWQRLLPYVTLVVTLINGVA